MKYAIIKPSINLLILICSILGCNRSSAQAIDSPGGDGPPARLLFEKHLKAVEDKDTANLRSTINMGGRYLLILPDGNSMNTAQEFYKMHQEWFNEPGWTIDMEIKEFRQSGDFAQSTVVATYREPDRNGQPYWHKMWITYVLENIDGRWFVTSDHASTMEKSE